MSKNDGCKYNKILDFFECKPLIKFSDNWKCRTYSQNYNNVKKCIAIVMNNKVTIKKNRFLPDRSEYSFLGRGKYYIITLNDDKKLYILFFNAYKDNDGKVFFSLYIYYDKKFEYDIGNIDDFKPLYYFENDKFPADLITDYEEKLKNVEHNKLSTEWNIFQSDDKKKKKYVFVEKKDNYVPELFIPEKEVTDNFVGQMCLKHRKNNQQTYQVYKYNSETDSVFPLSYYSSKTLSLFKELGKYDRDIFDNILILINCPSYAELKYEIQTDYIGLQTYEVSALNIQNDVKKPYTIKQITFLIYQSGSIEPDSIQYNDDTQFIINMNYSNKYDNNTLVYVPGKKFIFLHKISPIDLYNFWDGCVNGVRRPASDVRANVPALEPVLETETVPANAIIPAPATTDEDLNKGLNQIVDEVQFELDDEDNIDNWDKDDNKLFNEEEYAKIYYNEGWNVRYDKKIIKFNYLTVTDGKQTVYKKIIDKPVTVKIKGDENEYYIPLIEKLQIINIDNDEVHKIIDFFKEKKLTPNDITFTIADTSEIEGGKLAIRRLRKKVTRKGKKKMKKTCKRYIKKKNNTRRIIGKKRSLHSRKAKMKIKKRLL